MTISFKHSLISVECLGENRFLVCKVGHLSERSTYFQIKDHESGSYTDS